MKKSFFQSMVLGTCGSRGEINKLYSVSCRGRLRFLKGRTVLKDPTRYCTCVVWINPGVEEFIQVQCSEQKQEAQKPVSSWKFQGSFHKAISINTYKRKTTSYNIHRIVLFNLVMWEILCEWKMSYLYQNALKSHTCTGCYKANLGTHSKYARPQSRRDHISLLYSNCYSWNPLVFLMCNFSRLS